MKDSTNREIADTIQVWIDWKKRIDVDNKFVREQLKKNKCSSVYDLCTGNGIDSIGLLEAGFNVTGNDIESACLQEARENAKKHGVKLKTTQYDWRELPSSPKFDAALLIGNSLIYLPKREDREKTIRNAYSLLHRNGVFIIDHRNFDYMLKDRINILKGNYKYSGKYIYNTDKVEHHPIEISDNNVLIEYLNRETKKKVYLNHYALRENEAKELLNLAGFKRIETFYDYKRQKPRHYDFVQHVAYRER